MNISGLWRRPLQATLLAGAALLASCGGGTSQEQAFLPERVVVFGDESSLVLPDGRTYTVAGVDATGVVDCNLQPNWVQVLLTAWNYEFPECHKATSTAQTLGLMRASVGARLDDVVAALDAEIAAGTVAQGTMVAMMVGAHDVLDLYAQFPVRSRDSLLVEARERGTRYALQVNRAVETGARVIVATVHDVGLSPFGLTQTAAFPDTAPTRGELISELVKAYNAGLRVSIINDGRLVGLVLADESTQVMARYPDAFAVKNFRDAACTTALPDCTVLTLASGATGTSHLWADETRLAYPAHLQIGREALSRALKNPFSQ